MTFREYLDKCPDAAHLTPQEKEFYIRMHVSRVMDFAKVIIRIYEELLLTQLKENNNETSI